MTYLLHTYGCQMNVRDSEMLAALFESCGLLPARDEADADLILINTCAVREKAEDKAIGKTRLLCSKKKTRPLLVGFTGFERLGVAEEQAQRHFAKIRFIGQRDSRLF